MTDEQRIINDFISWATRRGVEIREPFPAGVVRYWANEYAKREAPR